MLLLLNPKLRVMPVANKLIVVQVYDRSVRERLNPALPRDINQGRIKEQEVSGQGLAGNEPPL